MISVRYVELCFAKRDGFIVLRKLNYKTSKYAKLNVHNIQKLFVFE